MLKYEETNWKYSSGFSIHKYNLGISTIDASITIKEQTAKIEKVSLVVFINKEQKQPFVNICRRLKEIDRDFYQNSNLHVTIFGFGPIEKKDYVLIQKRIKEFSRLKNVTPSIRFDGVRLGTMHTKYNTLRRVYGMSNGTVIAVGNTVNNIEFFNYGNQLTRFLLSDYKIESILGADFRRKFPTVWCTLGYYGKKNKSHISNSLAQTLRKYQDFSDNICKFPISELSLVKSKYKNLRYPQIIQKYRV